MSIIERSWRKRKWLRMKNRVDYSGKMNDEYPSFVWGVAHNYAVDPFDYVKVSEYLKKKYGKCRPKIYWATIEEITKSPEIVKPKLKIMNLSTGVNSDKGALYYIKVNTSFEIGKDKDYYRVQRECLVWVSEIMSQVLESKLRMYNDKKELVVEV